MPFLAMIHRPQRLCALVILAVASICSPVFASNITVGSPGTNGRITSPVWIRAHNIGCEGVPPTVFAYSIDNSRTLVRGKTAYDIDIPGQYISAGVHTVHFKSWTARGLCPVVSMQFTVAGPYASFSSSSPAAALFLPSQSEREDAAKFLTSLSGGNVSNEHTAPVAASISLSGAGAPIPPAAAYGLPPNAVSSGDLDTQAGWSQIHDGGTPGTSRGSTLYPATTPLYDDAREFYMTYTDRAGERWNITPNTDAAATHFVLDTYVFLTNPAEVMNLELDINQVNSNGETVILSTQCAGIVGSWEAGYTAGKKDNWWASGIKCDPRTWTANTWHHIQIAVHRNPNGTVTHDWVSLDGVYHTWNYTHICGRYLGWQPGDINVQYQIEGNNKTSGSVTSYIHKLTVYRW